MSASFMLSAQSSKLKASWLVRSEAAKIPHSLPMSLAEFLSAARPDSIEEALARRIDFNRLPRHVAIIMDGNGRWAANRRLPRVEGHRAGIDAVRDTVETSARLGISVLTLYAFSVENWKRPASEVSTLMMLLAPLGSVVYSSIKTEPPATRQPACWNLLSVRSTLIGSPKAAVTFCTKSGARSDTSGGRRRTASAAAGTSDFAPEADSRARIGPFAASRLTK